MCVVIGGGESISCIPANARIELRGATSSSESDSAVDALAGAVALAGALLAVFFVCLAGAFFSSDSGKAVSENASLHISRI